MTIKARKIQPINHLKNLIERRKKKHKPPSQKYKISTFKPKKNPLFLKNNQTH